MKSEKIVDGTTGQQYVNSLEMYCNNKQRDEDDIGRNKEGKLCS